MKDLVVENRTMKDQLKKDQDLKIKNQDQEQIQIEIHIRMKSLNYKLISKI